MSKKLFFTYYCLIIVFALGKDVLIAKNSVDSVKIENLTKENKELQSITSDRVELLIIKVVDEKLKNKQEDENISFTAILGIGSFIIALVAFLRLRVNYSKRLEAAEIKLSDLDIRLTDLQKELKEYSSEIKKNLDSLISTSENNPSGSQRQFIVEQAQIIIEEEQATKLDRLQALALSYLMDRNYSSAIKTFLDILEKYPDLSPEKKSWCFHSLGSSYEQSKQRKKAIENYLQALQINPGAYKSAYNLAVIYEKQGKRDSAIAYYNQCVRHNGSHKDAWISLGNLYASARNNEGERQAIDCYMHAITVDQYFFGAYVNLVESYIFLNEISTAKKYFDIMRSLSDANQFVVKLYFLIFTFIEGNWIHPLDTTIQQLKESARYNAQSLEFNFEDLKAWLIKKSHNLAEYKFLIEVISSIEAWRDTIEDEN